MVNVVVASTNPVKINAVKLAFESILKKGSFSFIGVKASSEVSEQPKSDTETLLGAKNRIKNAKILSPDAHFYVGLEGGVEDIDGELHEFAWIVIESIAGKVGKGKSCTFIAPSIFRKLVLDGREIGEICDTIFGMSNSKQDLGAIGILTKGIISRTEQYRHAVVSALIPFVNPEMY